MTTKKLRELDAWIAEHVMGRKCEHCLSGFKRKFTIKEWARLRSINPSWPKDEPDLKCDHHSHYTTDPAAAMEVLKKCIVKYDVRIAARIHPKMEVVIWCQGIGVEVSAETLELAICLFAKKLFTQ